MTTPTQLPPSSPNNGDLRNGHNGTSLKDLNGASRNRDLRPPYSDIPHEVAEKVAEFFTSEDTDRFLVLTSHRDGKGNLEHVVDDVVMNEAIKATVAKRQVIPEMDREIRAHEEQIRRLQQQRDQVAKQFGIEAGKSGTPRGQGPLTPTDRAALRVGIMNAERELPEKVVGQPHAIEKVLGRLKTAVTGTNNPNRPLGVFLCAGPTGVGKTLLARSLAESLSSDAAQMKFGFLKIDCSEFSHGHEQARLTGAPPGYIGFDKGGQFDAIKKQPFHVLLLDEIEKASPQFLNMLLQAMEDGVITLQNGGEVSFKNCIIFLTTNVGAGELDRARNPFGLLQPKDGTVDKEVSDEIIIESLKRTFPPEFVNRPDELIGFRDLSREDTLVIAKIEVNKVASWTEKNNHCKVSIEPEVIELVQKKGYCPEFGAREVRRSAERLVGEKLTQALFNLDPVTIAESEFIVHMRGNQIVVDRVGRDLPKLAA